MAIPGIEHESALRAGDAPLQPVFVTGGADRLTDMLAAVESELAAAPDQRTAFSTLTALAVERIPGAQYAGITLGRSGAPFRTLGETAPIVVTVDAAQYELESGPCVDASIESRVFNSGDLRHDARWPEFGVRAADAGIESMLSYRLLLEDDHDTIAALNLYSRKRDAFDGNDEVNTLVLATAGAAAVSSVVAKQQVAQLQTALLSNRDIGTAIGILMTRLQLTRDEAFQMLRLASQNLNRKLVDLARRVIETGELPDIKLFTR